MEAADVWGGGGIPALFVRLSIKIVSKYLPIYLSHQPPNIPGLTPHTTPRATAAKQQQQLASVPLSAAAWGWGFTPFPPNSFEKLGEELHSFEMSFQMFLRV